MKTGRVHFAKLLPPELRNRLNALVDGGQKSAAEIFTELGLVKYVAGRTLRTYVTKRRRERAVRSGADSSDSKAGDMSEPSASPSQPSSDALLAASIDQAYSAVLAGQVKASTLASLIIAISSLKGSRVREDADRRASEKHEVWKAEKAKVLKAAVDVQTEGGTKTLSREDIYAEIDKALRGDAA